MTDEKLTVETTNTKPERRYDLDWLRLMAVFLLFFFHTARCLLHQTVIVIIGYYVVQWDLPVAVKFALIVAASFASCVLIYDVLVRRTNITRFLFGMKPMAKKATDA